jgi:hypothetical protein
MLAAAVAVIVAADLGFMMRRPNMSLASATIMPVSIVAPPLAPPDPHPVTTTTTTTAPPPPPTLTASRPVAAPTHVSTDGMGMWSCIISHESGGNPHAVNRSSGAGGLFQFLPSSWRAYGGSGEPQNASVAEQWRVARNAYARSGFAPWRGDGCV